MVFKASPKASRWTLIFTHKAMKIKRHFMNKQSDIHTKY